MLHMYTVYVRNVQHVKMSHAFNERATFKKILYRQNVLKDFAFSKIRWLQFFRYRMFPDDF